MGSLTKWSACCLPPSSSRIRAGALDPARARRGNAAPSRTNHFLSVYGRLKPDVTLERARAEMDRVGAQLQKQYPEANRNHGAHVSPLRDQLRRRA